MMARPHLQEGEAVVMWQKAHIIPDKLHNPKNIKFASTVSTNLIKMKPSVMELPRWASAIHNMASSEPAHLFCEPSINRGHIAAPCFPLSQSPTIMDGWQAVSATTATGPTVGWIPLDCFRPFLKRWKEECQDCPSTASSTSESISVSHCEDKSTQMLKTKA